MALDNKFYFQFRPVFEIYYRHNRPLMIESAIKGSKEQREDLVIKINYLDAIHKEIEAGCKKKETEEE